MVSHQSFFSSSCLLVRNVVLDFDCIFRHILSWTVNHADFSLWFDDFGFILIWSSQLTGCLISTGNLSLFTLISPEGRLGMSDVLPLVWNFGIVIWFHFAISSLVLLPGPVTISVLSFSACWFFFLNFFQKILQYFLLRDRLFCLAPV